MARVAAESVLSQEANFILSRPSRVSSLASGRLVALVIFDTDSLNLDHSSSLSKRGVPRKIMPLVDISIDDLISVDSFNKTS